MREPDASRAGLTWLPIAEYDRSRADVVVLLRRGDDEAIGYWGVAEGDPGEAWRHAQESLDELRLRFDPEEYAEIGDEWCDHLMAD